MFLRFNFFFGLELVAPCRRALSFYDALRRLPMTIDSRKLWRGFSQILFHSEGKEDFA